MSNNGTCDRCGAVLQNSSMTCDQCGLGNTFNESTTDNS